MATNKYENSPLAPPLPDKMKTTNQTRISRLKKNIEDLVVLVLFFCF